jgi:4-carboxymuconolactone decarboxylase
MAKRIPYPDMASLSAEKRAAIGWPDCPLLNIIRLGLLTPDPLWQAHYRIKQAVVRATSLDERLREILILRVAYISCCDDEIHHHLSISAGLGFTPEQQRAIAAGDYTELGWQERAIAEFTDQVVRDLQPTDTMLATIRSFLDDGLVMEMLIIISSYMGTARMALTAAIDRDATAIAGWGKESPMAAEA